MCVGDNIMAMKYKTELTLFNSYFDLNNRLSLKAVLSIFQDVASIHAEEIGVGYKTCLDKNLYWVLSRVKLDIIRMPEINEVVFVETWPHEKGRIDIDRDMQILDENGNMLVKATSKWCVIDTVKRALQKSDDVNYNGECIKDVLYEGKFTKIILPKEEFSKSFDYTVRFSDLDHNGHMNNTNYANLVVSAVENKKISHFEINFINELKEGEKIEVEHRITENGEYVIGKEGEKTVFTAFTK